MHVISASRRTDLPAFYTPWLMGRIRAGYCHWINPFSGAVYRVSLRPEDTLAFVFWTRHPRPLFPYLDELAARGYASYFHVTITGYGAPLELYNPPLDAALRTFRALAERVGPGRVVWRYDPVVLSSATPPAYHLDRFATIAAALEGYTARCVTSFLDLYGKTRRNLGEVSASHGLRFEPPDAETRAGLLAGFVEIAGRHGIALYGCCEAEANLAPGMRAGRCVDPDLLAALIGDAAFRLKPHPTREHCGCVRSIDIGAYDTCLFGCRYCYATQTMVAARARHAAHDPRDTILHRPAHLAGVDLDTLVKPKAGDAPAPSQAAPAPLPLRD